MITRKLCARRHRKTPDLINDSLWLFKATWLSRLEIYIAFLVFPSICLLYGDVNLSSDYLASSLLPFFAAYVTTTKTCWPKSPSPNAFSTSLPGHSNSTHLCSQQPSPAPPPTQVLEQRPNMRSVQRSE